LESLPSRSVAANKPRMGEWAAVVALKSMTEMRTLSTIQARFQPKMATMAIVLKDLAAN